MGTCPVIQTDRLVLREIRLEDAPAWAEMLDQPEVRESLHLGHAQRAEDLAWREMTMFAGQWALQGTGNWTVVERESGTFVGRVGLHDPVREGWPGCEVGWTLHPRHWGRGYATEAGRAAIAYAFDVLGLEEVFSTILPANGRSQDVARRLGFELYDPDGRIPHVGLDTPIGIWRLARSVWVAGVADAS